MTRPAHTTSVEVYLDRNAMHSLMARVSNASARRAADVTRERVKQNIVSAQRIRTGDMLRSVEITPVRFGSLSTYAIHSRLDYTIFQEEGIGPVVARHGKVLRFQPKGSNVFIFRPRTKGFEGGHFFRDAHRALRLRDFFL